MIDRSLRPGKLRPGTLFLRTAGACEFDPEHLLKVFGEQRRRFGAILREFGPDDWAAPTRCADWSAQERRPPPVRRRCDRDRRPRRPHARRHRRLRPENHASPLAGRIAGESPDATLGRLAATTEEALGIGRYRLAQGVRFDVRLPYGPMDWTVLLLHRFWDSWIHERDVLLARGAGHPTDGDATAYATTYGVFIAAAVASMFADPVQAKLTLGGDGGGIFEVDSRSGVTLTVNRGNTAGPPAAEIADALAGRSPAAAVLGDLPASARAALSHLADFFNTPVEQTPTDSPK